MHTRFFNVLAALSTMGHEMNNINLVTDCHSTKEQFGTRSDFRLRGRWLAVFLPIDDAKSIIKDNLCIMLHLDDQEDWVLLCTKLEAEANIYSTIND